MDTSGVLALLTMKTRHMIINKEKEYRKRLEKILAKDIVEGDKIFIENRCLKAIKIFATMDGQYAFQFENDDKKIHVFQPRKLLMKLKS